MKPIVVLQMQNLYHDSRWLVLLALLIASRLMPHPPNLTATMAVMVMLQYHYDAMNTIALSLIAYAIADCLLLYGWGMYPSTITFFTYSGWVIAIIWVRLGRGWLSVLPITAAGSLLYWLWTNLGVWFLSDIYPATLTGLLACYTAALPFLKSTLIGDALWVAILSYALSYPSLWHRQATPQAL